MIHAEDHRVKAGPSSEESLNHPRRNQWRLPLAADRGLNPTRCGSRGQRRDRLLLSLDRIKQVPQRHSDGRPLSAPRDRAPRHSVNRDIEATVSRAAGPPRAAYLPRVK